jgi:hypothetical protein
LSMASGGFLIRAKAPADVAYGNYYGLSHRD